MYISSSKCNISHQSDFFGIYRPWMDMANLGAWLTIFVLPETSDTAATTTESQT